MPSPQSNADAAPCLSVIMPVYNEAATVAQIAENVLLQRPVQQLVIVDDGSSDGSFEKLESVARRDDRVLLLRHERNRGKGAALRTGFARATAPIVICQDADLEYDPAEYYRMLGPFLTGQADAVLGSRFLGSDARRVLYFWHALGNSALTLLSNMCTNINLSDMETGCKAFRREIIQQLDLRENRFGFEPEVIAKIAKIKGVRVFEVAVSYYGRTYAEGKKIGWRDGLSALRCIARYNFFARA